MKRTFPRLFPVVLIALALILAACSSDAAVKSVYTASGDGTSPVDLVKTTSFQTDDDLNVVVMLNSHSRPLNIHAVFSSPAGDTFATDPLEADETVGKAVLGLDWESQGSVPWMAGQWSVQVFVDDNAQPAKTAKFTVGATDSVPAAG